jgi:hypothetical protein
MASPFKAAQDLMLGTGFLNYFIASDLANLAKGGIDSTIGTIQGAYHQDEGVFREAGGAVGEVTTTGLMAAANLGWFMYPTIQAHGFQNTMMARTASDVVEAKVLSPNSAAKVGNVYSELKSGGWQQTGELKGGKFSPMTSSAVIEEASPLGKAISKYGIGGLVKNESKFIKSHGFVKGTLPFVGAFLVGQMTRSILGFAGGMVDEAVKDYHRSRRIQYDNRFFNTQRDQMTNYQTLGMAMNNYENRMMSTSRIYHSR